MDGARERELRAWLDGREGDYRISRGLRAETVAHRMPAIGRGVCPECNSKKILYLPAYDKEDHGDQIACGACGGMFAANVLLKSDLLHLFINSDRVETCLCFDPSVLGDEFTIGRSSKHCRLTAKRETFSRRHCAISWSEGRFWLEDCESTGGTWLNGKMLRHAQPLKSGDILSPDSDMRIRIAVVSRD